MRTAAAHLFAPPATALLLASAFLALSARAHGHSHGDNYDAHGAEESGMSYAERHMRSEHHIDAFDPESFFHLHDLNHDGVLDVEEIQAIYGVHHDSSKAASSDDADHAAKAKTIVDTVLALMDTDADGFLTLAEFVRGSAKEGEEGLTGEMGGLPDFKGYDELGHHYDEESEYFLHHEEMYHSTPETQTDEAYNHPEDIAHFASHEQLENKEAVRARKYMEAETETHADAKHDVAVHDAAADAAHHASEKREAMVEEQERRAAARAAGEDDEAGDDAAAQEGEEESVVVERKPSAREELRRERAEAEASGVAPYGEGEDGYKRPRTRQERMRKGTPYKYKFRRTSKEF